MHGAFVDQSPSCGDPAGQLVDAADVTALDALGYEAAVDERLPGSGQACGDEDGGSADGVAFRREPRSPVPAVGQFRVRVFDEAVGHPGYLTISVRSSPATTMRRGSAVIVTVRSGLGLSVNGPVMGRAVQTSPAGVSAAVFTPFAGCAVSSVSAAVRGAAAPSV